MLKLRDETRKSDKLLVTHSNLHQTNQQVSQITFQSTFSARISHERLWTHKTHHGPDLGKPPPSPIYYSLRLSAAPTSEWLFVLGFPRRSPEITMVWTPAILRDYNSLLRPPIGTRYKSNLQLSSRAFQWCIALYLHAPWSGRFLTFSGRESNCQFDFRPFFLP